MAEFAEITETECITEKVRRNLINPKLSEHVCNINKSTRRTQTPPKTNLGKMPYLAMLNNSSKKSKIQIHTQITSKS